jgi:hypothetical protein
MRLTVEHLRMNVKTYAMHLAHDNHFHHPNVIPGRLI